MMEGEHQHPVLDAKVAEDVGALNQACYGVHRDYPLLPPSEKDESLEKVAEKKQKDDKYVSAYMDNLRWKEIRDDEHDFVYVSGLPTNITEEEFVIFMGKAGAVKKYLNKMPRAKLYTTPEGILKGDGICCYASKESVVLALDILDGSEWNNHKIHVEKATFQLKGEFDPSKRKMRLSVYQNKKFMEKHNKAPEWKSEHRVSHPHPNALAIAELMKEFTLEDKAEDGNKENQLVFGN